MKLHNGHWILKNSAEDVDETDARPLFNDADAEAYVAETSFIPSVSGHIGVELEWLVYDRQDRGRFVPPDQLLRIVTHPTVSGQLSTEPGGQLELSSMPAELETCIARSRSDILSLQNSVMAAGLRLEGFGLDPYRQPCLQVDVPRYNAMLEAFGPANLPGKWMLCSTASVQVSIDAGQKSSPTGDFSDKWFAAYAIGPILIAAFANSPIANSTFTGWRSTRQATWMQIDHSRTSVPAMAIDPRLAWARYALDARVICIRRGNNQPWTAPRDLTFRQWVVDGRPRRPTLGDLRYHLTTLFPPIRPRGYLELRMIDAQRGENWIVPVAIVSALLDDAEAVDAVLDIAEPLTARASRSGVSPWVSAARDGVTDPLIRQLTVKCFDVALSSLSRVSGTGDIRNVVERFADTYVYRGRCPADDLMENFCGS
jgi:glutamate--cysteine ligase